MRQALASNPNLPDLLRSIDSLRGEDREEALQRALGVSSADVHGVGLTATSGRAQPRAGAAYPEEDVRALRQLAEAVEAAVRGGREDVLGLDWGD